jgi:SdrD B-like domain
MNRGLWLRRALAGMFASSLLSAVSYANISGNVFQDFNSNGVRDTTTTISNAAGGGTIGAAVDVGLGDVSVSAVCVTSRGADGVLGTADDTIATFGPVTTDTASATRGNYSIATSGVVAPTAAETAAGKVACRVSFNWNEAAALVGGLPNPLYGMRPAFVGTGSNTATQFVNDGATANFGLNYPSDFCQNNPNLASNCGTFGPASTNNAPALFSFPYSARSTSPGGANTGSPATPTAPTPTARATASEVGATWGIAYHKQSRSMLVSAYFKRHIGVGPGGVGQIYLVPATSGAPTNFVNLETLVAGSAGVDPRVAGNDFVRDRAVLSGNDLLVGKLGIGDIDLSDDGTTLYAVGLASKRLYRMSVGNGTSLTPPTSATTIALPTIADIGTSATTGCPVEGDLRPFALKYNKGFLYVGITCTAESTITDTSPNAANPGGDATRLRAFVYRMDPSTNAFTQVANFSLNVTARANPDFGPWNNSDNTGERPEPLVADIEFNGANMLVGVRDRFGDSTGRGTQYFDITRTALADGRGHGDTYLACPNASGLYDPANCATSGFTFYQDNQVDQNSAMGGLAQVPGFPDYAYTKKDPVQIWSSGIGWNNHATGAYTKGYEILYSNPGPQTGNVYNNMGKSSSFGDIEALCDAAPLEIGNRVWNDANGNGVQDPGEPPIANVTVNLYAPGGTAPIATAVTDNNGNYYFSNKTADENGTVLTQTNGGATVDAITGLTPNTSGFSVCVNNASNYASGGPLASLGLTTANATGAGGDTSNNALTDLLDSDAQINTAGASTACNGRPSIVFNTDGPGQNNFGLDIGFTSYSLGNRVWFDADNSGTVNGSESGVDGVVVELLVESAPGSGVFNPTGTTLTTANGGYYRFDGLTAGNYQVRVNASNFAAGGPLRGYFTSGTPVANADGDANNDNNGIAPAGGNYVGLGVTSGTVTLGGVTPEPTNDNTEAGTVGANTYNSTNSNGTAAPDNQYNATVDFGFHKVSIGNRVWFDTGAGANTNNGIFDGGEANVPDGTVVNLYSGTTLIATTTTTGGTYMFMTDTAGNPLLTSGAPTDITRSFRVELPTPPGSSSTPTNPIGTDEQDRGQPGVGASIVSPDFTLTPGAASGGQTLTNATATTAQPQLDFGIVPQYSIGNRVWLDSNSDGTRQSSEPGRDGVVVNLLNSSGQQLYRQPDGSVSTTVSANPLTMPTAGGGYYRFDNLPPGDYVVQIAPVNFQPGGVLYNNALGAPLATSPTNVGGVDGIDNNSNGVTDANPGTNGIRSGTVTLGNGTGTLEPLGETDLGAGGQGSQDNRADMTVDFGFIPVTYSLGNRVWVDTNNNGSVDGSESGLEGATVNLLNGSGQPLYRTPTGEVTTVASGNTLITTTTSNGGHYLFTGLPEGSYTVEVVTTPVAGRSYVSSTGINGGASGPFEPTGSNPFGSTNTNFDHGLQFAPNVIRTRPVTLGPAQPTGEDGNATPGQTDTTPDNRSNLTIDIGVFLPASVGTVVWIDDGTGGGTAGDGIKQPSEPGIPGVVVTLVDSSGNPVDGDPSTPGVQPITTTTGPNGTYSITNLIPGTYAVQFSFPPGSTVTTSPNPGGAGNPPTNSAPGGPDNQFNEMNPTTRRTPPITLTPGQDNPNLGSAVRSFSTTTVGIPMLNGWMLMLLAILVLAAGAKPLRRERTRR